MGLGFAPVSLSPSLSLLERWGSPDWMTSGRSWNGDKGGGTCVQCLVQLPQIRAVYLIQDPQRKMVSIRRGWSRKAGRRNRVRWVLKVDSGARILNVWCGVNEYQCCPAPLVLCFKPIWRCALGYIGRFACGQRAPDWTNEEGELWGVIILCLGSGHSVWTYSADA